MSSAIETIREAALTLEDLAPELKPRALVVLGSGLGSVGDAILTETLAVAPFESLPGLVASTVPGHSGQLVLGRCDDMDLIVSMGRLHLYEGASAQAIALPVRAARLLGCETLIVTNASGAIREGFAAGSVALISDHIDLTGADPLVGANIDELGPRFPWMGQAYSPRLRALALECAREQGIDLPEAVYAGVIGPSYETPAEVRALRALGADIVGMSTVAEVTAAVHCGLEVVGLSVVTNDAGAAEDGSATGHEEVLVNSAGAASCLSVLIEGILSRLR